MISVLWYWQSHASPASIRQNSRDYDYHNLYRKNRLHKQILGAVVLVVNSDEVAAGSLLVVTKRCLAQKCLRRDTRSSTRDFQTILGSELQEAAAKQLYIQKAYRTHHEVHTLQTLPGHFGYELLKHNCPKNHKYNYVIVHAKPNWAGLICRTQQHYHCQWLPTTKAFHEELQEEGSITVYSKFFKV